MARLGRWGRVGAGYCLGLGVLTALSCGTTADPDGTGGAGSDSGGSPLDGSSSGGATSGGAAGNAGECERVHSMEDYCHATVEQAERCEGDDSEFLFDACMQQEEMFDRLDVCFYEAVFDCTSSCDWLLCRQLGAVEALPELFNQEVAALCFEEPERTDVDCSDDNRAEGRQQTCVDRAQECETYDGFDVCLGANAVRPEFLVETDTCLAGPCEELFQCLIAVSEGPSP